jgi:hypothetical protein
MRYIFLCSIFFTTTCLAQHRSAHHPKSDTADQVATTNTLDQATDTTQKIKNDTAKAVMYQSTESETSKKIYINDTTFFAIHFVGTGGYETVLLGNEKSFETDKDLDNFITVNRSVILTKKIFVIRSPETSYGEIKPVLDILKAHQFYEFQIVAE